MTVTISDGHPSAASRMSYGLGVCGVRLAAVDQTVGASVRYAPASAESAESARAKPSSASWAAMLRRTRRRARSTAGPSPVSLATKRGSRRSRPIGLGQLEPDARAEQSHEHVAVHERTEVAEHRLDGDVGALGHQVVEDGLVLIGRLGNLHSRVLSTNTPSAGAAPGPGPRPDRSSRRSRARGERGVERGGRARAAAFGGSLGASFHKAAAATDQRDHRHARQDA